MKRGRRHLPFTSITALALTFVPLFLLLFLSTFAGCASNRRQVRQTYQEHLQAGRWEQALQLAKGNTFYQEERSKLLKLLELGTLHHLKGEYFQSQNYFDQARELGDRLFTVSISKKVLKAVGSDSLDHFYGEIYERSLLRFYSVLNHYLLYQQGLYESYSRGKESVPRKELSARERRRHLDAARAMVVEWNAKIKEWRDLRAGETVYKDDLLAKVLGAFIHMQMGSQGERNIAQLLYREAGKVLFQNYNAYPSFNARSKEFKEDFEKLPQLERAEVEKQYVQATPWARDLQKYLREGEKSTSGRKRSNVAVVVHHDLIAAKRPKKYYFPLDFTLMRVATMGKMGPAEFALDVLGLAALVGTGGYPSIEFELPEVPEKAVEANFYVQISRVGGPSKSWPLQLINPMNDIAREAIEEHSLATRLRLGVRLAGKHLAAIASAYTAYQTAIGKGTPSLAAQFLAKGLYVAANRAIAASEQADLRAWLSLPHSISMTSFYLGPGTYQVKLQREQGGEKVSYPLAELSLKTGKSQLINARVF